MVSKKLKTRYAVGKLGRAAGMVLPIFAKDNPSDFVNEILREDEEIRQKVIDNPQYRELLERNALRVFKDYKHVLTGSRLVDSWDRVTSAIGEVADVAGLFTGGAGNLGSLAEEGIEQIPKSIYSLYYVTKTGDWKAIPYWGVLEGLSCIPYVGDFIDMANIYVNRARKITKKKVKEDFKRMLKSSNLERKVA